MEIKFRAWDKDENEMIYDVQNTYDYHCSGQGAIEESFGSVLSDRRYIVMQYVNLTDSCGTELYDGDISVDDQGRDWITFSTKGGFGICRVSEYIKEKGNPIIQEGLSDIQNANWFSQNHVIVGNLYQHSQLMQLCNLQQGGERVRAIIFGDFFEAPDELNEFVKSLGYGYFNYKNFDIMFDPRVVDFCEQRLSPLWNEMVYKGKESDKFRCGFAGAGYIRDIDTNKKWNIRYNHVDSPIINYIDVRTNDYGYTKLVPIT